MWITRLKVALFALFLAAPVSMLLLFGSVAEYGGDHPDFPSVAKLLRGKKGRMDQFGNAVLHRSAAMKLATEVRNWVSYRIVGFVDTELIVSGSGDWLFYRPEFDHGRCIDVDWAAIQLRKLGTLIDVARDSGIDMVVSLSPDKSAIYPEKLSRFARGYWRCRSESAATLRRLIRREVPSLIDHAEALLAEKRRHPDVPLYYTTDTHWTSYGGALALRQLLAATYPKLSVPPPRVAGTVSAQKTDLSGMLMLPVNEPVQQLEPLPAEILRTLAQDSARHRTVIGHDSFYRRIQSQVRAIFPDAILAHLEFDGERLGLETLKADRLVINVVERALLQDIDRGSLSWNAPMPRAVIARNRQRAEDCSSFEPAAGSEVAPFEQDGDRTDEPTLTISIRAVAPRHLPCLSLSLTAREGSTLEILLPNAATGAFDSGRSVEDRLAPGEQTVRLVLPDYVAGSGIRLRITGSDHPATISSVAIGEIERPLTASESNAFQP